MTKQRGARIRATTLAQTTHTPWAYCDNCDWAISYAAAKSWPAVREASRRHAAHNNHTVNAEYRHAYVYGVTVTAAQPI